MKKLFIIFILLFSQFLFLGNKVFSAEIPVEKAFSDINKNYKYYHELQTLYNKGMIFPDENGKFNPKKLLNRDEFVGISMEVACKKCISPNTDFSLIKKYYGTKPFYDVAQNNKYFYCIAESDALNYVKGYDKGHKCENNKNFEKDKKPFCVDNKITLDEALAVILRNSGIFTIEDNQKVIKDIYDGKITKKLSDDVSPKNNNGQVYTFYGYLQKALNFTLIEFDKNGKEKIYHLLQKRNNKIYPYKKINKEEFLIMAYVALKSNSCIEDEKNKLALNINILNKKCIQGQKCNNKNFDKNEDTFDLVGEAKGICKKGINNQNYKWTFYNFDTKQEIKKQGKYLDNYKFLSAGKWRIILKVRDNCGNKGEVMNSLYIYNNNNNNNNNNNYNNNNNNNYNNNFGLNVQINADPLIGNYNLLVNFEGIASGGNGNYTYKWDFGDLNKGNGKNIKNNYIAPGIYKVKLIVTDSDGNNGEATVLIKVLDFNSCEIDADGDGIVDCADKCPKIKGEEKNNGCPIFEKKCGEGCSCQKGYECTDKVPDTCSQNGVCIPKKISLNKCLEKGFNSYIYGNIQCQTCPCQYKLDFFATIRKCDLVFPAITSIDSKHIFSKGLNYKIQ